MAVIIRNGSVAWGIVLTMLLALALVAAPASAETAFSKATYHGKPSGCPKGAFFDPRKGGECWSCEGRHRTVFPVTDKRACERRAYEKFKRAKRGKKTLWAGNCKGKWFWDPWKGGRCWSCEGWRRTAYHINSGKACVRQVAPKFYSAKYINKLGCPGGQFFDPRKGGQCWSCPSKWHRTVNPVTSPKACASSIAGIFSADTTAFCTQVISAVKAGQKGAARLMDDLENILHPVMKPVSDGVRKVQEQISTPAALDDLVGKLAQRLRPYRDVVAEVQRFSQQMQRAGNQLKNLLLDPKVMCQGSMADKDRRLIALGLRPNLRKRKSGLLDNLLVPNAYAGTKEAYAAFFGSLSFITPEGPFVFTVTLVTNFAGKGGVYFSPGSFYETTDELHDLVGFSVGGYIFPAAELSDFEGIGTLSVEISFGAGETLKKLFKKAHLLKLGVLFNSFNVTFDPLFQSVPGFGVSKDLKELKGAKTSVNIKDIVEVGGSFDASFKLPILYK